MENRVGSYRTILKFCKDCGKKLTGHHNESKRCKKCSHIGNLNSMFGISRFGNKSPNWIDGRTFNPYPIEFNESLKETIRKRDNYKCQNCEMTEEEHLIVIGQILEVHHVDYNKQNCNKDNLITLCKQCNLRANANRDYWEEFYTRKRLCQKNV
jgi:hypothetical protein